LNDSLTDLLFKQEGQTLVNLKLLRGDDPQVSESELRGEAHAALLQALFGNCESHRDFPEERDLAKVDIKHLAAV